MKLTTSFHPAPRLRMYGITPPGHHPFSWRVASLRTQTLLLFQTVEFKVSYRLHFLSFSLNVTDIQFNRHTTGQKINLSLHRATNKEGKFETNCSVLMRRKKFLIKTWHIHNFELPECLQSDEKLKLTCVRRKYLKIDMLQGWDGMWRGGKNV
jgi:hypothetical protein